MSDRSFGDNANRNIVKNPLLSTAVTGLSFEDLTHNAVLFPVSSNQEVVTGSDLSGNQTQTLANTDNEPTKFHPTDTNLNTQQHVSQSQPYISQPTYSNIDIQTGHQYDKNQERPTSTMSKASAKSEDDFDVNEYFARLQGTRYVSAPIHSHPDPNSNLVTTEDNLEEINLNDDKNVEVHQSLTADIAQNFSQLPNVLPHVASAVFSSFSNMWNMKSREQTPDNKGQSYQEVQFQDNQNLNQMHSQVNLQSYQDPSIQGSQGVLYQYKAQGLVIGAPNVQMMRTEDTVKEVAPPPKEPPVSGTSNFRLPMKKKYAQIPGLSTKETQSIVFNPMTQNVPSYFTPSNKASKKIEENKDMLQPENFKVTFEQNKQAVNDSFEVLNIIDGTTLVESQPQAIPTANQPKMFEDHSSINLQNQMTVIPPPPMFSSQRRNSQTGKAVLPPSVARRIGSNNPVIKQHVMQQSVPDHIFVPNFDSTPKSEEYTPQIVDSASQTYSLPNTISINDPAPPIYPEVTCKIPLSAPKQTVFPSQAVIDPPAFASANISVFNPIQSSAEVLFTPALSITTSDTLSPSQDPTFPQFSSPSFIHSGSSSLPILPPALSAPVLPPISVLPASSTQVSVPPHTTISPPKMLNICATQEPISEPPKPLMKPPKAASSNFRMTKKRPQYYSGPIEGIGSISNSIKPLIPLTESSTFQGALFTPEQPQPEQYAPSFDINKQIENSNMYTPFTAPVAKNSEIYFSPQQVYPSFDKTQPSQDYSQQYNTAFNLSRPSTHNYEEKDEPKESKGIGIIGSLKSKLSSLDINKIQNSVTTFFDPAYNVTSKDNAEIQENVNYAPTQYQTQSNFEIVVPNIENQPFSAYQANHNIYDHTYQDYSNPHFEQHIDNKVMYSPKTNIHSEHTQTLNQPSICTVYGQDSYTRDLVTREEKLTQCLENYEVKGFKDSTEYTQSIPFTESPVTKNIESRMLQYEHVKQDKPDKKEIADTLHDNTFQPGLIPATQAAAEVNIQTTILQQSNDPTSKANLTSTDAKTLFETSSNYVFCPTSSAQGYSSMTPSQTIGSDLKLESIKQVFESKQCHDILNYRSHGEDTFSNVTFDHTEKQGNMAVISPQSSQDVKVQPDNLLDCLTKGDEPVLAVSSMPLFGLSTIIADKTKEGKDSTDEMSLPLYERVKNKDTLDRNAGTSFFENISSEIGKGAKSENSYIIGSLDKNMGFFQKDRINTDKLDAQITSSRLFSNNQTREDVETVLDTKASLFDNFGAAIKTEEFGFNKDLILDRKENKSVDDFGIPADIQNVTELNICETCREVNKPDERETEVEDLTTQLIENLTAPIQLANPVEVPLTEDNKTEGVEFDAGQFEEICHITEDTIENIHAQSATELLDDTDIKMHYGWTAENNYTTNLLTHNYGYNVPPMGLFGETLFGDNVPANASDELKAEFKHHEDLIPKQMSLPSAPPEEDLKTEEAGILDVQSIELDAKQDFPIYEEFVIEPSETDDDKIECKEREKTEENDLDSFTNRVEKFKKLGEVPDLDEPLNLQKCAELPAQPISMASYFDTGNYAAEAHYRNTIHSPQVVSIPPGFEEEFKKRLALAKAMNDAMIVVPNTSTQTAISTSICYTTANTNTINTMSVGFNVEENVANIVEEKTDDSFQPTPMFGSEKPRHKLSDTTTTFNADGVKMMQSPLSYLAGQEKLSENTFKFVSDEKSSLKASTIFGAGEPKSSEVTKIFGTEEAKMPITSYLFSSGETEMPKVSNIFASGEGQMPETSKLLACAEAKIPDIHRAFNPMESRMPIISSQSESSNILIKPIVSTCDNPLEMKSHEPNIPDPINFFAESTAVPTDNFNRLASYFSSPPKTDHAKSFFELSQSQNHYRHELYTENKKYENLIKDLTSVQNFAAPTDQIIRHVNYFTVEYDTVITENSGDMKTLLLESDEKCFDFLSNCRYCIDLIYDKSLKVKTAVNDNKDTGNTVPKMENVASSKRQSVTVSFDGSAISEEASDGVAEISENRQCSEYGPVKHHWFYRVDVDDKSIWRGFSAVDSRALETTFLSPELNENTVVATDGGRYDVNVVGRLRIPVYWTDKPTNVRRCSWFYKGTTDPRYVPYTEAVAEKLEIEYQHGVSTGEWHRRLLLPNGEVVVMHGPSVMVHFLHNDAFSSPPLFTFGKRVYRNPPKICVSRDQPPRIDHLILLVHGAGEYRQQKEKLQSSARPRVVRRGCDDSEIEDAEPSSIDHLLLLCHGVGSACDMRFRSVEEVVEDFRATSLQLVQSHYRQSYDQGIVSRVEVLPISWHSTLHSGETGVDRRLAQITLDSIPRLRSFTNDTVLDVLFYTSPVFCQTITNTVCKELNRIYKLFRQRNPGFKGGISLGGHSLGSVILYDLLCHQTSKVQGHEPDKNYVSGSAGTGQPTVMYPSLDFQPDALYALGSPIAIFECIRGVESLGSDFSLPTCKNFFNIFHPYDPIAYRIEPLINPRLKELKPYLIPHHKGRKRMHLELKDTMARVGADLKQKLVDSLRSTWNKWKSQPNNGSLDRVMEETLDEKPLCDTNQEELAKEKELARPEMLGRLNGGRRVDYVLQEAPLEMINEYLFAMSSHVGYWESEDTMLLMLREIYSALGVQPDCTIPQQSLTVQRTRTQDTTVVITADNPSTSGLC